MQRVQNKVALITGGGSGIGQATALLFAREGAAVALMGRRQKLLDETAQEVIAGRGRALAVAGDVSDEAGVRRVVDAALDEFGRIDVLVNCAGVAQVAAPLHELTDAMWEEAIHVNLTGTFRMIRAVLPHFLAAGGGAIVNVASISALAAMPGMAAYSAAKNGVIALTRSVAVEYGQRGIRCNCVCPGAVETPMTEEFLSDATRFRRVVAGNLLPRIGQPQDIAGAILYLASEESSFLTGAVLTADGGYTAR